MRLSEIAEIVKGEIVGSRDIEIKHVAKIEDAGDGDITFLANPKYKRYLATTNASVVLVAHGAEFEELTHRQTPITFMRVSDPYHAFITLIDLFHPPVLPMIAGIHPSAIVSPSSAIHPTAAIGPLVVIGNRCRIGENTTIHAGTVISDDVQIGYGCMIYANVTVREQCRVGNNAIIHSGTVIGSDGFGFNKNENGSYEKIPQRGIVIIEDDVEIGANCTIDRATIGATSVKRGAKLDNLIHIAHNVVIGEHTAIAAQTGISGSTKVGQYCQFGGQVGLTGHIHIADHTTIGAQSGVPKSITEPGKTYMGYPAREIRTTWKIEALLQQLPELFEKIQTLQDKIQSLETRLSSTK